MIDRDDHHIVFSGEFDAVVADEAAGAAGEAPAMQPYHDRELASPIERWGPHVQDEAVLTHHLVAVHGLDFGRHHAMEADSSCGERGPSAVASRIPDQGFSLPGGWNRAAPAVVAP